jgi:DNA repair exonuclease SbcCD ATPase subunit
MNYYCECCNYSTKIHTNYKKHMETKKHQKLSKSYPKLSKVIQNYPKNDTFLCNYCNKEFKYQSGLCKHIKYSCKENKDEDLKELVRLLNEQNKEINNQNKEIMNDLKNTNEQNKEIMNELKSKNEQIKKLQKQIDKLSNKLKIKNIHNNTQNNTINYNIQLLNYNDTDYSHLTTKDYIKCINDCNYCVKSLIEKVHFNNKKPENKNIYISNIKNGYVMLYKDNKWQLAERKSQIDDLYDYNEVVLDTWYRANKEKHPDIIKSFTRYLKMK